MTIYFTRFPVQYLTTILTTMRYLTIFSLFWLTTAMAQHNPTPTISTRYNTCLSLTDEQYSHYFLSEVANTPKQRQTGMMFRQELQKNHAMLFIFERPMPLSFWMKNVVMPLDMLFFDNSGKLQEIKHDVPPCTTMPCPTYPSKHLNNRYVLEIKGGTAAKYALSVGATLQTAPHEDCHD